jgi:hypothetical protein
MARVIDIINQLDIADGLKELFVSYGFTLELLVNMTSIKDYSPLIICISHLL